MQEIFTGLKGEKGVLAEEDLVELQNMIDEKNKPADEIVITDESE